MKLKHWAGIASATAMIASFSAQAADVTLRFAHPWPAGSAIHNGLEEWSQSLNQASDGRIEVQLFPSQTLAKAAKSYDAVIGRIADVTATVQGYTANRFPLTQVIELPGIVETSAQGSCILQKLYDQGALADEYSDTHVLFVYTNGPGHLHTRKQEVKKPEDLAGMRIRRPTTLIGELFEELGAQSAGMPAPEIYQSLQRNVIDGVAISWDGAKVFRLNELTRHHTELNLYSLSFVVTMNKDVYSQLPVDLKTVVDTHSGEKWSQHMAAVFDDLDKQSRSEAQAKGSKIVELTDELRSAWQPALQRVTEKYLDALESQGLPARKVYQHVQILNEQCTPIEG